MLIHCTHLQLKTNQTKFKSVYTLTLLENRPFPVLLPVPVFVKLRACRSTIYKKIEFCIRMMLLISSITGQRAEGQAYFSTKAGFPNLRILQMLVTFFSFQIISMADNKIGITWKRYSIINDL